MELHSQALDLDSNHSLNVDGRSRTSSKNCSSKVERLKRMGKLIVSICVFPLVLSLFFSSFSLFPHSFSVYVSTFLFSFLNHTMERKYMFLICNGILFLLSTSYVIEDSFSSSSSFGTCSFPHSDHHQRHHFEHHLVASIDGSDSEESEQKNQEEEAEDQEEEEEEEEEEEDQEEENYRGELEKEVEEDEGCFTDEVEEEEEEGKMKELEMV